MIHIDNKNKKESCHPQKSTLYSPANVLKHFCIKEHAMNHIIFVKLLSLIRFTQDGRLSPRLACSYQDDLCLLSESK